MITTQEPQEEMIVSQCKKNSDLRTFHSSATLLWSKPEPSLTDTLSQKRFLRYLQWKIILENSLTEHFNIKYQVSTPVLDFYYLD